MTITKATITMGLDVKAQTAEGSAKGSDQFTALTTTSFEADTSGAGGITKEWNDTRSISGAASDNIDLSGSLTNREGQSAVFTTIQGLYLKNTAASGVLTYGGGSNPVPGLPAGTLGPGERVCFDVGLTSTGHAVTAATGDMFNLASSASLTYEICVIGQ